MMQYAIDGTSAFFQELLSKIEEAHRQLKNGEKDRALLKLRLLESSLHTELAMREVGIESVNVVEHIDCSQYTLPPEEVAFG